MDILKHYESLMRIFRVVVDAHNADPEDTTLSKICDAVADEMDLPWDKFTPEQEKLARKLAVRDNFEELQRDGFFKMEDGKPTENLDYYERGQVAIRGLKKAGY